MPTAAISFEHDIKPLFRNKDIVSMRNFGGFDLSLFADVVARADEIYLRLSSGAMPCDGAWPQANVQLFKSWIDGGKQA